jgi:2-polyprenyl-3-methyl-5-hydroxy-6-metoxy-1,4-benzoquinol methylase
MSAGYEMNILLNLYHQFKERIPFKYCRKSKAAMLISEKHNDVKESRFERLLKEYYGVEEIKNITDPVKKMWVEWSLQTVERGNHVKDIVSQHTPLEGKRYLDIGCGHGGFLVAFKQAGVSEAIGIDINPTWIECSKALAEEYHVEIPCYQKDILNSDDIDELGMFDILTCNDVIEHVPCPDAAMHHIARLLRPTGLLFMEIPNKFSAAFIKSDGHFKLFGITLLPKWMADRYFNHYHPDLKHSVRYKSLSYYINIFSLEGLECEILNLRHISKEINKEGRLREIQKIMEDCKQQATTFGSDIPMEIKGKVIRRVSTITSLFERQFAHYFALKEIDEQQAESLADHLVLIFGEDFWRLIVRRASSLRNLRSTMPTVP